LPAEGMLVSELERTRKRLEERSLLKEAQGRDRGSS